MTTQTWAEPGGYTMGVPIVAYRILDKTSNLVIERRTESAFDAGRGATYLALSYQDQQFAEEYAALVQKACEYFYKKDNYTPMEGWAESRTTDAEVKARIYRIDEGENSREAERSSRVRYPLQTLPWALQRALIEQIDRLKAEWQFEFLGEVGRVEPLAPPYADYMMD